MTSAFPDAAEEIWLHGDAQIARIVRLWSTSRCVSRAGISRGSRQRALDQKAATARARAGHGSRMPEISRFLVIVIRMYYRDHPPPHFHARYADYSIVVEFESGVVEGRFPPRALRHLLEWTELRREELRKDWELARARKPLFEIPPLE